MKKVLFILLLLLAFHPQIAQASSSIDQQITDYITHLKANPYFYSREPSFVVVCNGQITYTAPTYRSMPGAIVFPDTVNANGCDLYIFHPPYINGQQAAAPAAPQDLYLSVMHGVHRVIVVGFDISKRVGTEDVMTQTRAYWPVHPFLDAQLDIHGKWIVWEQDTKQKAQISRDTNAYLRSVYQSICVANGGWTTYIIKEI